ncbi:MAG TPA: hypothetical protein VIJ65_06800 [Acidobacteriaceae bacterium]
MLARSLLVLILAAATASAAQNPVKAFPQNYKVVLDSPEFSVLRVHYRPHENVGLHDHSAYSTIYVYLNDSGPVRFQHSEEAKPFDIVRPPTHAGAFRVSPGRIERHSVENLSELPSDYLRIELKRFPPGTIAHEFRGSAPKPPLVPGTTVAYASPQLRIDRIICPSTGDCQLHYPNHDVILIRIPNHALSAQESEQAYKRADEAVIEPWHKGWNFTGDGSGPYQILRISILRP